MQEEPIISVKPFVKDWVLKHCDSQNNSPNKANGVDTNNLSLNEVGVSSSGTV